MQCGVKRIVTPDSLCDWRDIWCFPPQLHHVGSYSHYSKSPLVYQGPRRLNYRRCKRPSHIPAISYVNIKQECYTSLIENLDVSDVKCLKYSLSKILGIGIVFGGSIVKVPQILLSK